MFGWFKKSQNSIVSPVTGKCIPIEEVQDEAFAKKVMGNGFAVVPTDQVIVSPVAGKIISTAKTKHAYGILTKDGKDVLVHVGIDSVKLGGEGFVCFQPKGKRVKAGDRLMSFDPAVMNKNKIDMTTVVVFVDQLETGIDSGFYGKSVKAGEVLNTL